jgi:UDP-N-acetylmuramate dehydrogenase
MSAKEATKDIISDLLARLPDVRGKLRADAELSKVNWFQVGGTAEILFKPEDADDLAVFMAHKPADVAVTVLGVGSNLLVRDGGIDGVVIRLGKGFTDCHVEGDRIIVGAGCLNSSAVKVAHDNGIGGLEFLSGIPGGIGGALAMNAGAYGNETKHILVEAEVVDPHGHIHILTPEKLHYSYRHCGLPEGWIFTRATLQGVKEDTNTIAARIEKIASERASTQPIRSRTGGSTFKNPEGHKAWKLIEAAGCRGHRVGGAEMSQLHCNFMINTGTATAQDLETLGEEVRMRVFEHSGIMLEWEIKRIGKSLEQEAQRAVA